MSEPTAQATPATSKRKRAKSTTSRAARVMDPDVAAIRRRATVEVKQLHQARASEKLLKTIIEKRLAQLTLGDKEKLFDHLKTAVTPALLDGGVK